MVPNLDKLHTFFAEKDAYDLLGSLDLVALPTHVAIIMDGNGRWAKERGLSRSKGHEAGVASLRETITACVRFGIAYLTAFAFSTENWRRSKKEVDFLMQLFANTLIEELPLFHQEHVKLNLIGDLEALPERVQQTFNEGLEQTKDYTNMTLTLAVNYGSQQEIARACALIAQAGIAPEDITPNVVAQHLYTKSLPNPDLLIRTSGEMRLSNFLLFQLAYAELYVTQTLWPDFDRVELAHAFLEYQHRDRRFGKA